MVRACVRACVRGGFVCEVVKCCGARACVCCACVSLFPSSILLLTLFCTYLMVLMMMMVVVVVVVTQLLCDYLCSLTWTYIYIFFVSFCMDSHRLHFHTIVNPIPIPNPDPYIFMLLRVAEDKQ